MGVSLPRPSRLCYIIKARRGRVRRGGKGRGRTRRERAGKGKGGLGKGLGPEARGKGRESEGKGKPEDGGLGGWGWRRPLTCSDSDAPGSLSGHGSTVTPKLEVQVSNYQY
jgi:hypothetical protein